MSLGSYFPPAVRSVEIAKKGSGQRALGVSTVSDRADGSQDVLWTGSRAINSPGLIRLSAGQVRD